MSNQEKLVERSKKYEQDISEQFTEISGKAGRISKNVLMVAGGVFIAYQAVKLITGGGKKSGKAKVYKEVEDDENEYDDSPRIVIRREQAGSNGIFSALKAELGGMLVAIARDKILEFLSQLENQRSDDRKKEAK